jgi:hypothetical protein
MRLIFSLFLSFLLSACALLPEKNKGEVTGPLEQVFHASYEEVWRASQLALQNYPMRVNNMDLGLLETDVIRGFNSTWTPPHLSKNPSGGLAYKIVVKVVKGSLQEKAAQQVSVFKDISLQKDFFSDSQRQASDGLEEQSILYRITREIQIDRAIQKSAKRSQ